MLNLPLRSFSGLSEILGSTENNLDIIVSNEKISVCMCMYTCADSEHKRNGNLHLQSRVCHFWALINSRIGNSAVVQAWLW